MPTPPSAPRRPVTVVRHGETFVDDFAWLRDRSDPATEAYLGAENRYAAELLAPTAALQETLYREMLGRIKETDLSVPIRRDGYWYYSRTEEGKQYSIYCRRRGSMTEGAEEVLVDLNRLGEGKAFIALGDFAPSDSARFLAYSTDDTGYRQYTLVVRDLDTGEHLDLRRERVTSVAWTTDDRELHYTVEDEVTKRSHQLWRLRFGDANDELVYQEDDEAFSVHVARTRSRKWLVLHSASHTTSESRVRPTTSGAGEWRLLLPRAPEIEYDVDHHGESFYIRINDTGRNFRVVRAPTSDVRPGTFVEVLPHRDEVMLESVECFATFFVATERDLGVPGLLVQPLDGRPPHRIEFPEPVRDVQMHSNPEWAVERIRIAYQSLVTPSSVFEYDTATRERVLLKQQEVLGGYDPVRYVSERLSAVASDGTAIPISLVRRRDLTFDGTAPCLLEGYGAYGYPFPIAFSSNRLSLLERGFVVAIAHVRGGGEMGKAWHDAGRMSRKMHTFTDFIAATEELVRRGVAARGRIAIEGASAGGLLMGAVTNLRPELFRAVVSLVPFVDVLNTMSDATLPLTVGEYEEWGNPAIREQFGWMRAYCPYTNLREGIYPAILVRTSLNDSQVMFWEPAKYVARLRLLDRGDAPVLLLTNMGAGHGGASGRYDHLREIATDYAFIITATTGAGDAFRRPPTVTPP